jgi:hypothetical protein
MNVVVQNLLVAFLAVNALFWGLMPHKVHCELVNMFTNQCASHNVHLAMGFIAFILAVVFAQWDHVKKMMN